MLTDTQLANICSQEIRAAYNLGGDLSNDRADALDYYLGEPYGDEQEGRSQVVTTEVRDTIQSILPSLMRIFRDADNLFTFDPTNADDEDAAEQESDRVTFAYFKQNPAFINTLSFCTDALLSKTGVLKAWWAENPTEERAEYKGLSDRDLQELFADESVEREIIEFEEGENGYDITFTEKRTNGQVKIVPVTPEDFGVNNDARSANAQDCEFVWHRVRKTKEQLLADGFSELEIEKIPKDDSNNDSEESLARRHLSDEYDHSERAEEMRVYWVTECYLRIDMREDGTAGMWKVTLATSSSNIDGSMGVMAKEEVDGHPFFSCTPVLMTHKFTGLSIADLVMDIQRIKSTILRNILDNSYLANNRRHAMSNRVTLDDMLTNRPGGVVRVDTEMPDVAGHIAAIQTAPMAQETFGLLEYLDTVIKDRTGSGDEVGGLDAKSLANVNSSVAALAYDQARMKVEMIAELIAEIGFRPLFKRIHELLQKCQDKKEVMKLRGKWVEVNPAEWRTRENMTIHIGMGVSSRERRLVALETVAQRQGTIVERGGLGTLVSPENLYNSVMDHAEAMGVEGERYYMDPKEAQPKQEQGPGVQEQAMMMTAQAQMGAARAQGDRNKVAAMKVQADERIRIAELKQSERELQAKGEIAKLNADLAMLKSERAQADIAGKAMLDNEITSREQELKVADLRMKDSQEAAKRETDMYKALLASSTTLTQEQMRLTGVPESEMARFDFNAVVQQAVDSAVGAMSAELGEVKAQLMDANASKSAPIKIDRDEKGLAIAVNGRPVKRDKSGRMESIG